MQTKRENRGGKREGAGRKKSSLSINQINQLLKKSRKYAREHKKTVEEILLDMIYGLNEDPDFRDKDRLAAIKLYMDRVYVDIKEGGEADTALGGPALYLPEKRPDPANEPTMTDESKDKAV